MSAPEEREITLTICAANTADARALFEKAMRMVQTGKYYDGELVPPATEGGGCASLHVHRDEAYGGRNG